MKKTRTAWPSRIRITVWLMLTVFALSLTGSMLHISCCQYHGDMGEMCPVCVAIFRYYRVLLGAGLTASVFMLPYALNAAGIKPNTYSSGWLVRATPVRLCVRLLN